ncbi:methyl-accepting chemotaxis protein [Erwinia sp. OLTSP20]|uniref:methyl-accepting chemotaxis protein n=1 Tax=unclassified Erwinia TaxID=2622719 RepID=UPI000C198D0C|nr:MULTISPECIES: methyl-accepting chemotaxis protein [unclassified Erwinia]PIJ49521.1 methyl-accepting chemotaxis protein [Erwinia sp. OAMSP11]PIJ71187.1 methyl-accepting chemotaxis protein [Erwinia sp. OLSSP12]PIJ79836.1 methyl-accepting chemotaxis protein [Erwinia sp. OLCASP19]PIJ81599.1 methyl-accepting chemotaxis protein [Erwinia sp. OLMTSP26]PIJ84014.1 methyl-accepting chemotaxis protein [Erwinia sp. OLMDSP33]
MRILKNFTIRRVMLWVVSLLCIFWGGVSFYGVYALNKLGADHHMDRQLVAQMATLNQGNDQYFRFITRLYRVVSLREAGQMPGADSINAAQHALDAMVEQLNQFKNRSTAAQNTPLTQAVIVRWERLLNDGILPQMRYAQQADLNAYHRQANEVTPVLSREFGAEIEKFNQATSLALDNTRRDVDKRIHLTQAVLVIAVGIGILMLIFSDRYLVTMLVRPLDKIRYQLTLITQGDLSQTMDEFGRNCLGRLVPLLCSMQQSLLEAVGTIRQASDGIHHDAARISSGNQNLSSRTEQQASALEQTAASMEQLTATVKCNADNARQASELADTASATASKGGQLVQEVVVTMEGIAGSAHKIADITNVINSIAFQTNILALNAAVEAARAGEQGRGFAVVASEVRNLAQRSASAAKEIDALIADSVTRVDKGNRLVNDAGAVMQEMLTAVSAVNDIMKHIAAASEQQSKGISQVGLAVNEMDQVTQQNASLVAEMASAANALEQQTINLAQSVAHFRFTSEESSSAALPTVDGPLEPSLARQSASGTNEWVAF